MSIGIIQQQASESTNKAFGYFDRAIMQSNPLGLALKDAKAAEKVKSTLKDYAQELYKKDLNELTTRDEILTVQKVANRADKQLIGWFMPLSNPNTSNILPYAPYIETGIENDKQVNQAQVVEQPYKVQFKVPTVLSYNKYDSSKFASVLDLTFLYNLSDADGNPLLGPGLGYEPVPTDEIVSKLHDLVDSILLDEESNSTLIDWPELPPLNEIIAGKIKDEITEFFEQFDEGVVIRQNLYNIIPRLFFGLFNNTASGALKLADYAPNDDKQLLDDGALGNITKYHKLMNDVIYACASYSVAQIQEKAPVSLYQYEFNAGFSVNPLDLEFPEDIKQDPLGIIDRLTGR